MTVDPPALAKIETAIIHAKVEIEGVTVDQPVWVLPNLAILHLYNIRDLVRRAFAAAALSEETTALAILNAVVAGWNEPWRDEHHPSMKFMLAIDRARVAVAALSEETTAPPCDNCDGSGEYQQRVGPVLTSAQRAVLRCQTCGGSGRAVPVSEPTAPKAEAAPCHDCEGSGRAWSVDYPCSTCDGSGIVAVPVSGEPEVVVTDEQLAMVNRLLPDRAVPVSEPTPQAPTVDTAAKAAWRAALAEMDGDYYDTNEDRFTDGFAAGAKWAAVRSVRPPLPESMLRDVQYEEGADGVAASEETPRAENEDFAWLKRRAVEWQTRPILGHGLHARYQEAQELIPELLDALAAVPSGRYEPSHWLQREEYRVSFGPDAPADGWVRAFVESPKEQK